MLKLANYQKSSNMFYWYDKKFPANFYEVSQCVGPGWSDLIEDLCVKLFALGWDGGLAQVKEKYGTLSFYWTNNIEDRILADVAFDVVHHAEGYSGQVCEQCGKYGEMDSTGGWMLTLCDEHKKERAEAARGWAPTDA